MYVTAVDCLHFLFCPAQNSSVDVEPKQELKSLVLIWHHGHWWPAETSTVTLQIRLTAFPLWSCALLKKIITGVLTSVCTTWNLLHASSKPGKNIKLLSEKLKLCCSQQNKKRTNFKVAVCEIWRHLTVRQQTENTVNHARSVWNIESIFFFLQKQPVEKKKNNRCRMYEEHIDFVFSTWAYFGLIATKKKMLIVSTIFTRHKVVVCI